MFDLGLSYYDVIDLNEKQLREFFQYVSREDIIKWLQWNDPNGIYEDEQSINEIGQILSKSEGVDLIVSQILQS